MSLHRITRFISRRDAVKILAGSAGAAAGLPILNNPVARAAVPFDHTHVMQEAPKPVGPYAPKFFTPDQMQLLAELVEVIIPTDEHSPGAKSARVHEYIDEVIAVSDANQKTLWADGLATVGEMAKRAHRRMFERCSPEEQVALLLQISKNEDNPTTPEEGFFRALKELTISGYYTSEVGIHQDLQYQGNTYLDEFPGCAHPEHQP